MSNNSILKVCCTMIICALFSVGCKNDSTHVEKFYTANNWDRKCPRLPLYPPISIEKHFITPHKWNLTTQDLFANEALKSQYTLTTTLIDSIVKIGVDKGIVYGVVDTTIVNLKYYDCSKALFYNYDYRSFSHRNYNAELRSSEVKVIVLDSIKKLIVTPKRWFIINTKQKSFNEYKDYDSYHKALSVFDVDYKYYDVDSIYAEFKKNRILPWFPDRIKALLK